jgi:hypothetical protein
MDARRAQTNQSNVGKKESAYACGCQQAWTTARRWCWLDDNNNNRLKKKKYRLRVQSVRLHAYVCA